MENLVQPTETEEVSLKINNQTEKYLSEIRKWANFLAIMGFIGSGFMVIAAIFIGVIFSKLHGEFNTLPFNSAYLSLIYLFAAILYIFPSYYLYKFALKMKYALLQKADEILEDSFRFLKSHYKFLGILTITMLALYPIIMIVAIIFGMMSNM